MIHILLPDVVLQRCRIIVSYPLHNLCVCLLTRSYLKRLHFQIHAIVFTVHFKIANVKEEYTEDSVSMATHHNTEMDIDRHIQSTIRFSYHKLDFRKD